MRNVFSSTPVESLRKIKDPKSQEYKLAKKLIFKYIPLNIEPTTIDYFYDIDEFEKQLVAQVKEKTLEEICLYSIELCDYYLNNNINLNTVYGDNKYNIKMENRSESDIKSEVLKKELLRCLTDDLICFLISSYAYTHSQALNLSQTDMTDMLVSARQATVGKCDNIEEVSGDILKNRKKEFRDKYPLYLYAFVSTSGRMKSPKKMSLLDIEITNVALQSVAQRKNPFAIHVDYENPSFKNDFKVEDLKRYLGAITTHVDRQDKETWRFYYFLSVYIPLESCKVTIDDFLKSCYQMISLSDKKSLLMEHAKGEAKKIVEALWEEESKKLCFLNQFFLERLTCPNYINALCKLRDLVNDKPYFNIIQSELFKFMQIPLIRFRLQFIHDICQIFPNYVNMTSYKIKFLNNISFFLKETSYHLINTVVPVVEMVFHYLMSLRYQNNYPEREFKNQQQEMFRKYEDYWIFFKKDHSSISLMEKYEGKNAEAKNECEQFAYKALFNFYRYEIYSDNRGVFSETFIRKISSFYKKYPPYFMNKKLNDDLLRLIKIQDF